MPTWSSKFKSTSVDFPKLAKWSSFWFRTWRWMPWWFWGLWGQFVVVNRRRIWKPLERVYWLWWCNRNWFLALRGSYNFGKSSLFVSPLYHVMVFSYVMWPKFIGDQLTISMWYVVFKLVGISKGYSTNTP